MTLRPRHNPASAPASPTPLRAALSIALVLTIAVALGGCGGSTRSVAAVCHVWDSQGLALYNKYAQADHGIQNGGTAGLFKGIVDLVAAPNDLAVLFDRMAAVAPESTAPDFNALASALHKEVDNIGQDATNPLAGIASGLVSGLAMSGSYDRVNQFLTANCGIPGQTPPTHSS
jgi:hypothetical protein